MCTDHHNMTLAFKVALICGTTNKPNLIEEGSYIEVSVLVGRLVRLPFYGFSAQFPNNSPFLMKFHRYIY